MQTLTVLALAGALVAAAPVAHGQSPADEAEALVRQGTELRHLNQDARALPYFEGAYHLSRNPRTAAQLGLVKMALGYCVDAERLLDEALAVPDHPWIARNRDILEQTRANARKNIGEVTVTGSPDGAEVLVNGRPVGTLPLAAPVRLDRGPAEIQVRAPGYAPASRALAIEGGARTTLALVLIRAGVVPVLPQSAPAVTPAPLSPAAPAPPASAPAPVATPIPSPVGSPDASVPERPGGASWLRPVAFTAGGVAVASLAFAVVETVIVSNRTSDFNDHTSVSPTPDDPNHRAPDCQTSQLTEACRSIRDAHDRARTWAVIGYAGAAAFAATSATLFVAAHRQTPAPGGANQMAARLACAPALSAAGVTCRLIF